MQADSPYVVESTEDQVFRVNRKVFVSDDILHDEGERIFSRQWVYAGHASEIKNPGDFRTRTIAGRPVIFCRDSKGEVRAFLNTCRHRGAKVCREREGNARGFYCFYHGWTYRNDGSLRGVPGEDAYGPAWKKEDMGLISTPRLESYKDFYFVNFDSDAENLHDYLAGAKDYIDLIVEQSPSGKMEIISGTQEYEVRANWKMMVENSVDDYHLLSTHITWMNYMSNSGVNMKRPEGALLPSKGKGIDLGNGHLCIDNPNYRGRPVAAWIPIFGDKAKDDITAIKQELVERLGEDRAGRVADTNRNLSIFPNLVINDGSSVTVRNFTPVAPGVMKITAWALGPVEETEEQRARRLDAFLTFYGPGGFATPDDVAALEAVQEGFSAWREVEWNDLSRGMAKDKNDQLDTDEEHIRVFWRKWSQIMEGGEAETPA